MRQVRLAEGGKGIRGEAVTDCRYYVQAVSNASWYVVDRETGKREGPFKPSQATAIVRDRNGARKVGG